MPTHRPDAVVIYFACPCCDSRLRAAVAMAGRHTTCPHCSDPLTVPAVSTVGLSAADTWPDLPTAPG